MSAKIDLEYAKHASNVHIQTLTEGLYYSIDTNGNKTKYFASITNGKIAHESTEK